MKKIIIAISLLLISCNDSSKIVGTNPKPPPVDDKNTEVNTEHFGGLRFICAGGSLNSSLLVFRANAQPSVYPSLLTLVTEAGSQQILGVEELLPLVNLSERAVRVAFRAKEYVVSSHFGGWQHYYYLADLDYINRKIEIKKLGPAPVFSTTERNHIAFDKKQNRILLPLKKENQFYYGWYSVTSQKVISLTAISPVDYYNPVIDGSSLVFDFHDISKNKFIKTFVRGDKVLTLPAVDQVGPTMNVGGDWFWLSRENNLLKINNYSKNEQKNYDILGSENIRLFYEAHFTVSENKIRTLVAFESPGNGQGELRWLETDRDSGRTVIVSSLAYPKYVKPIGRRADSALIIKGLYSLAGDTEVYASFTMPDESVRLFRYRADVNWQQVSRSECSNVKYWNSSLEDL